MSETRTPDRLQLTAAAQIQQWRQQLVQNLLRLFLLVGIAAIAVGSYNALTRGHPIAIAIYSGAYLVLLLAYSWRRAPYGLQVGAILGLIYALGIVDLLIYGWAEDGRVFLLALAVLAAIFLDFRAGLLALALTAITLLGFSLAYVNGWLPVPRLALEELYTFSTLLSTIVILTALGVLLVMAQHYLTPRLLEALSRSSQLAQELETQQTLLAERALALQQANLAFQRRAMYLEATTQVTRTIATIFDQEALLQKIVELVTEYFDFYHTGIFLMDETGDWAVLQAASSVGGKQMLAAGHRLRRGEESMVGWVVEHRQSRMALDVGRDAVHFVNPYLPATRSEVAVPLLVGGRLLGVLDVQSTEEAAFDQDDVRVLEALAGQVAVALENARRLTQEAAFLEATSPFYRLTRRLATVRTDRQLYGALLETIRDYNPRQALLLAAAPLQRHPRQVATLHGTTVWVEPEESPGAEPVPDWLAWLTPLLPAVQEPWLIEDLLAPPAELPAAAPAVLALLAQQTGLRSLALIPLLAAGQPLAWLLVFFEAGHRFTPTEARFYQTMSDIAGVVLDSARLYQETQRRVERERAAREIADRLRQVTSLDELLQTSIQEIRTVLGATEAFVQLGTWATTAEAGVEQEESGGHYV